MAGGQVTILWDRDDAAEVTITTAVGGGASFTVGGSPVTFPYSLTEDTTFVTTQNEAYRVSVTLNGVEIAAVPDGVRVVNLLNGSELTFAPKPDDGFVSPSGGSASGEVAKFIGTATADTSGTYVDLTFAQDPNGIVTWADVVDGNIELTGPLLFTIRGRQGGTVDFTAATGFSTVASESFIEGFINYEADVGAGPRSLWNDYKIPVGSPGTVFEVDAPLGSNHNGHSPTNSANHAATISGQVGATGYDESSVIVPDGVYDATFAIWITKDPMPDLPTLP